MAQINRCVPCVVSPLFVTGKIQIFSIVCYRPPRLIEYREINAES